MQLVITINSPNSNKCHHAHTCSYSNSFKIIAVRNLSHNHTPSRTMDTTYGDKAFLLANHSVPHQKNSSWTGAKSLFGRSEIHRNIFEKVEIILKCGNIHPQSRYFKILLIRFIVKDSLVLTDLNAIKPGVHILRWFQVSI